MSGGALAGGVSLMLPENPGQFGIGPLSDACRRIYEHRDRIIGDAGIEAAMEGARRARAIEAYIGNRGNRDEARRAARVLETAVGTALGEVTLGQRTDLQPSLAGEGEIAKNDRSRFRLMALHRAIWMPMLEERALSRRQVLFLIEQALRPVPDGAGTASIAEADAAEWLDGIANADLLLTDPPYSTDVEDIGAFVSSWLPPALAALRPTARAFIFIGAYIEEITAYGSAPRPAGWEFGVPHAWVYRNAIGPTPGFDFVRNWQAVVTIKGPDAPPMRTDRITDLLAGYVENIPDGRQEFKLHRWQKPISLIERLIKLATDPGQLVVDPFAGSGTTLIAARDAGRLALGCDSDPEAVRICLERGCEAAA